MHRARMSGMLDSGPDSLGRCRPNQLGALDGSKSMTTSRIDRSVSRRSAIAGIGAGGAAVALAAVANRTSAQEGSLADHPLTGTWLTLANPMLPQTPQVPHIARFGADGTVLLMAPPADIGPTGVVLQSALVGLWEAYDAQRGHFTATQPLCDLTGHVVGMVTVDGYPLVSEDGQAFADDGELVTITIRDAAGAVVDAFPGAGGRPVRGNRLTFDNAVFPDLLPDTGTPTS
jgi:hypothetical protein